MPDTRANGDDLSCPPLFEGRDRGLRTVIGAEQIDFERGAPGLWITVFDGPPLPAHPGVDDQDVQPAKRLDRDLHHLLDGGELRHVRWHGKPLAPRGHNVLHGLVDLCHRTRRATYCRPCPGIGIRDGFANASPGSCHNGDFPPELLVGGLHTFSPEATVCHGHGP